MNEKQLARLKELTQRKKSGERLTKEEFQEFLKLIALAKKAEKSPENSIDWWNKYPNLLKDACNIVFNEIAGTPFDLDSPVNALGNGRNLPVGARIEYIPTVGVADDENSAFNYQMRDLWLAMHRKYRGIGTYESSDLGMAIFAILSIFRDVARAERIYGVCSLFNVRNRSTPSVILKALDVEADSYTGDQLADFRYQLNRLINSAHRLCLPKGMSALDAFISLNGLVFKDADNVRAQWYVYDSKFRVQYDASTLNTGGSCVYVGRTHTGSNGLQTFADIIADLTTDIYILLADTDIARMCSDILAAFGDSEVVSMFEMPEDYVVEPVRDETRELQFHNATICGAVTGGAIEGSIYSQFSPTTQEAGLRIYQSNNVIKQHLFMGTNGASPTYYVAPDGKYYPARAASTDGQFFGKPILNTWKEEVGMDDLTEMTRLTVPKEETSFTSGGSTYYTTNYRGYGIYVVANVSIYLTDGSVLPITSDQSTGSSATFLYGQMLLLAALSKFDWHPVIFIRYSGTGATAGYSSFVMDLDNYCSVDKLALIRMHDACCLSAFKLGLSVAADRL